MLRHKKAAAGNLSLTVSRLLPFFSAATRDVLSLANHKIISHGLPSTAPLTKKTKVHSSPLNNSFTINPRTRDYTVIAIFLIYICVDAVTNIASSDTVEKNLLLI